MQVINDDLLQEEFLVADNPKCINNEKVLIPVKFSKLMKNGLMYNCILYPFKELRKLKENELLEYINSNFNEFTNNVKELSNR